MMSAPNCSISRLTFFEQAWNSTDKLSQKVAYAAKIGVGLVGLATAPLHLIDFGARRLAGACGCTQIQDRAAVALDRAAPLRLERSAALVLAFPKTTQVLVRPLSDRKIDTKSAIGFSVSSPEVPVENWCLIDARHLDSPAKQVFAQAMAQLQSRFGGLKKSVLPEHLRADIDALVVSAASQAPQNLRAIPVATRNFPGRSAAVAIGTTYPNPAGAALFCQDGLYLGKYASVVTDGVQGHDEGTAAEVRHAQLHIGMYVAAVIDTIGATKRSPCDFLREHYAQLLGMIAQAAKGLTGEASQACFTAVADFPDGTAVFGVGDCAARLVVRDKDGQRSVISFTAQPDDASTFALGGRDATLPVNKLEIHENVERILIGSDGVLQTKNGLLDLGFETKKGANSTLAGSQRVGPALQKGSGSTALDGDSKELQEADFLSQHSRLELPRSALGDDRKEAQEAAFLSQRAGSERPRSEPPSSESPRYETLFLHPQGFCEATVEDTRDVLYNALASQAVKLRVVSSHKMLEVLRASDPESPLLNFLDRAMSDSKAELTDRSKPAALRKHAELYLQRVLVFAHLKQNELVGMGVSPSTLNALNALIKGGKSVPQALDKFDSEKYKLESRPLNVLKATVSTYLGLGQAAFNLQRAVNCSLAAANQTGLNMDAIAEMVKAEIRNPVIKELDDFAFVVRDMIGRPPEKPASS